MNNILKSVLFLCGIDILFNKSRIIKGVINFFISVRKIKKEITSEELTNLCFGC